jgi:hypothetical protein
VRPLRHEEREVIKCWPVVPRVSHFAVHGERHHAVREARQGQEGQRCLRMMLQATALVLVEPRM